MAIQIGLAIVYSTRIEDFRMFELHFVDDFARPFRIRFERCKGCLKILLVMVLFQTYAHKLQMLMSR